MISYRIRVISLLHSIIVTAIMLPVTAICAVYLFPYLHVLAYAMQFLMLYLVITRFSITETEWTLHPEGLRMHWVRQLPFSGKPDLDLPWEEIQRFDPFEIRSGRGFDLTLANGKRLRFYNGSNGKDEYSVFVEDFDRRFGTVLLNRPPEFMD